MCTSTGLFELLVSSLSDVTGWMIQLGITRRHSYTYFGQKLKVKRVVPHPNYDMDIATDNDVALFQVNNSPVQSFGIEKHYCSRKVKYRELKRSNLLLAADSINPYLLCFLKILYSLGVCQLEEPVQFHDDLRPVCLPSADTHLVPGTLCTVIGWGKKNDTDGTYCSCSLGFNRVELMLEHYSVRVRVRSERGAGSSLEQRDL